MSIQQMTDENWYEMISTADKPLIVEYYADWCHPCKMMEMVLAQIDAEYGDTLMIAKVDVDKEEWLRGDGPTSIPHIRVYNQGEYVGYISDATQKSELIEALKQFIEF